MPDKEFKSTVIDPETLIKILSGHPDYYPLQFLQMTTLVPDKSGKGFIPATRTITAQDFLDELNDYLIDLVSRNMMTSDLAIHYQSAAELAVNAVTTEKYQAIPSSTRYIKGVEAPSDLTNVISFTDLISNATFSQLVPTELWTSAMSTKLYMQLATELTPYDKYDVEAYGKALNTQQNAMLKAAANWRKRFESQVTTQSRTAAQTAQRQIIVDQTAEKYGLSRITLADGSTYWTAPDWQTLRRAHTFDIEMRRKGFPAMIDDDYYEYRRQQMKTQMFNTQAEYETQLDIYRKQAGLYDREAVVQDLTNENWGVTGGGSRIPKAGELYTSAYPYEKAPKQKELEEQFVLGASPSSYKQAFAYEHMLEDPRFGRAQWARERWLQEISKTKFDYNETMEYYQNEINKWQNIYGQLETAQTLGENIVDPVLRAAIEQAPTRIAELKNYMAGLDPNSTIFQQPNRDLSRDPMLNYLNRYMEERPWLSEYYRKSQAERGLRTSRSYVGARWV